MTTLSRAQYITRFDKNMTPAVRLQSGETLCLETQDCYMDNLRAPHDPRGAAPGQPIGCNPATGPVFVEGAHIGDTLRCDVLSIEVGEYASMRISNRGGVLKERVTEPIVRCIPLQNTQATLAGVAMPLDPMIGVIGVAPAGETVDTETPGAHGGNLDTRHIRAGSTLYLPVHAEGALFALGDVHARMGDGESCICALECSARVTVRLSVIPGRQEPWPILFDQGRWYALASATELSEAVKLSLYALMDFIEKRVSIDHNELILLMSLIAHTEISQLVNPLVTARAALEPFAFPELAF